MAGLATMSGETGQWNASVIILRTFVKNMNVKPKGDCKMKRVFLLFASSAFVVFFSGCFSTYPAMSESAYQTCIKAVNDSVGKEGYVLKEKANNEGGYHDKYRYKWESQNGEWVEYTVEVHRGDNNGTVFVDEVSIIECNCSVSNNGSSDKCDVVKKTLNNNQILDSEGRKFDPGKTVLGVIFGTIAGYVSYVLLLVALVS